MLVKIEDNLYLDHRIITSVVLVHWSEGDCEVNINNDEYTSKSRSKIEAKALLESIVNAVNNAHNVSNQFKELQ